MGRGRLRKSWICLPLTVLVSMAGLVVCADQPKLERPPFNNLELRQALYGQLGTGEKEKLDAYLKYFFKNFLQPAGPDILPELRADYKTLVRNIPKSPAHDYVNNLLLKQCTGMLVDKKYDISLRYNAMLLISDLNEDDGREAKPLPGAFEIIMKVVGLKTRPDLDFLKPAALVGLARFAEERGIPKERTAEVADAMMSIVNQKDPPAGTSASTHDYLRRNAAHVLALMGSPGADGSVAKAFEAMLTDPQSTVLTRCEMARYIGMLKYPPTAGAELQRLANLLGHQAVEICGAEVGRSNKEGPSRRFIMYALDSSANGLEGLYGSAERGSEPQKFIGALRGKLAALLKTLSDLDETKESEVGTTVSPELDKIKALLTAKPAAGRLIAAGR
jgi:hypothetical protein